MKNYILWNKAAKQEVQRVGVSHSSQLWMPEADCVWVELQRGDIHTRCIVDDGNGNLIEKDRTPPIESVKASTRTRFSDELQGKLAIASTSFGKIDADLNSVSMLSLKLASMSSEDTTTWKMYDNSEKTFSKTEFTDLLNEISKYQDSTMAAYWNIKNQIQEADSLDTLYSITWP